MNHVILSEVQSAVNTVLTDKATRKRLNRRLT